MKNYLIITCITFCLCSCQLISKSVNKTAIAFDSIINDYQTFKDKQNPFNKNELEKTNLLLPDLSPTNLMLEHQKLSTIAQRLDAIQIEQLPLDSQINYSVLVYTIKNQLDAYTFKEHFMPLTAESGFHVEISRLHQKLTFETAQDYHDYLNRLSVIPLYFSQQMALMDEGIKQGYTQPEIVLNGFENSIIAYIVNDITKSIFYQPFLHMPDFFEKKEKEALINKAKTVIRQSVYPSYRKYYTYMVEIYKPNARKNIAASSLPLGDQFYLNRLQHYTSLPLSINQVHNMGLAEVERIKNEMQNIITESGFTGNFQEFIQFLRTDKQFYATSAAQLLKEASYIAKKMDAQLPKLFKTLPRIPYGVMAVPATIAPKYTTGRYSSPSQKDQPGYYWVNTYQLDRRPLYVLEALTLHEAVPGHHLQQSIATEMKNVPKFRNNTYISAFGEGWGLYSEYLGLETGFYQDPYSNFGRLTYEMWRACRLVIDTGIHAKGWSRDKAINYLASNTALSLHNVTTEVDRYISWPGQALSYKIGEITIKRLRKQAQKQLGSKFDLREFHDQVLKNGSIPLSMLEKVIAEYVKKVSTK